MRNSLRIVTLGAALAAASLATSANAATTATATASAEVLTSLTVAVDAGLRFGQIAANSGGSVVVNSNGAVSSTGSLISTGVREPAAFTVTGSKGAMVVVSVPTVASNLTRSGGTETMVLNAFNASPNGAFQLDSTTGKAQFTVGGTLTVGNNQAAGLYNGTFNVSVEYQ